MADFKAHLVGGVVVGSVFSAISLISFGLNIVQSFAIFTMGLLGGILPDLDSDSGKPLALISGSVSVLIPALLLSKINTISAINSTSPEFLISYFTLCYLIINYVICELIKKMTKHRGIMHSIPFSFFSAEMVYLLFSSSGKQIATMAALTIFFGCLIHLILDELNAFYFKFGFIPILNKSSGTALKLYSQDLWANFFMFCLVCGATIIIVA
ncbi:MAG: metal-dependent hydrolase [gamma proteobacterium symbiont of Taylorina sp.]|nr:metal-dependent hydrolase [gamma proteobacterium symbiont of Taylorina sp.]